jgi:hypothetical protein
VINVIITHILLNFVQHLKKVGTKEFPQVKPVKQISFQKIKSLLPKTMLDAVDIFRGDESFWIQIGDSRINLRFVFAKHAAVENIYRPILPVS